MATEYEINSLEPESMNVKTLEEVASVSRERLQDLAQHLLLRCAEEAIESKSPNAPFHAEEVLRDGSLDLTVGGLNLLVKVLRETRHILSLRYQYSPYGKKE